MLASDRLKSVQALQDLFFEIVANRQPMLFIEAGAKGAGISRRARNVLPKAQVVAFEANPYVYEKWKTRARGYEYLNLALSDRSGELPFHIHDGIPADHGQHSLLLRNSNADVSTVRVNATTLDDHFANNVDECCIWMDVEGATGNVLRGAPKTLDRTAALLVEMESRAIWQGQWLAREVSAFLNDLGLRLVARDDQSRFQYNAIFVRSDVAARFSAAFRTNRWQRRGWLLVSALRRTVKRITFEAFHN
jgi:FkbM family methyltransferase